ncbi:MAG: hypothetical protein ABIJ72_01315 [bacterium]
MPQAAEVLEQEPQEAESAIAEAVDEAIEAPPEQPPEEPTPDASRIEQFNQVAAEIEARRNNLESAVSEPHQLAEALSNIGIINVDLLKHYLEAKKGVFSLESPEQVAEMAEQLMKLENEIITPMIDGARKSGKSEEQIGNLTIGAREAFYGMVLNGTLTVERIREVFDGQILFSQKPGAEFKSEHHNKDEIGAYLCWNGQKFDIHLYDALFASSTRDIGFLFRHEFSHAAAPSIWGMKYFDFIEAAKNPNTNTAKFADTPELQQVLFLVANPRLAKPFFREYISGILSELETATDPQKIAELRQSAAKEIVADLTAHFLEGSQSADVFCDLRMRYLDQNPQKLLETVLELEGVASSDELLKKYFKPGEPVTPNAIFDKLSTSIPLTPLIGTSKVWQERLTKLFEDRGANLSRPKDEFDEDLDLGWCDEEELVSAIPPTSSAQQTSASQGAQTGGGGAMQTFLDLWGIITGGASQKQ